MARAQGLPGKAVNGEAVDHALGNAIAAEPGPLVALVAIGAGEPKPASPFPEEGFPPGQGRGGFRGDGGAQGQAPGAVGQARGERKEGLRFIGRGRLMLALALALTNEALKILEALGSGVPSGQGGNDLPEAFCGPVAARAGGHSRGRGRLPQGFAPIDPEQARIGEGVGLEGLELLPQVGKAGLGSAGAEAKAQDEEQDKAQGQAPLEEATGMRAREQRSASAFP